MRQSIDRRLAPLFRPSVEDDGVADSRDAVVRSVAPFAFAFAVGMAFYPATTSEPSLEFVLLSIAAVGALILAAVAIPWRRLPSNAVLGLPLSCIAIVGLFRHLDGGPSSGWAPLVFLPTLWVAFYGTRRQLLVTLVAMAAVFAMPIVLVGAPVYGPLEWRRAVLQVIVGGFAGFGVQILTATIRERARAATGREALLTTLMQTLPDLVTLRDETTALVYANQAARESASVKPGEPVRKVAVVDGDRAASDAFVRDVIAGQQGLTLQVRLQAGDTIKWFESRGAPISIDGKPHGLFLSHEVTEQVELLEKLRAAKERAEAADRSKSEFLSRMSHELRTPLNAILGFGQLLELSPDLAEDDRRSADQVVRGGRHLLALINDILDLSAIETGRLDVSLEPVSVGEVVSESLALVEPQAVAKQITIAPFSELQASVRADRQRLRQVLVNLLSNAVKYNRVGGTVAVVATEHGDRLRIAVRDDGRGIPAAMLGRLFQPFERLGAEQSGIEGTGIGLALSRRLAEAMGGSVGVESTEGEGSVFWIELPVEATQVATRMSKRRTMAQLDDTEHARTLLYIEDNQVNIQLVERIVATQPGLRLISATHGSLGIELAREHRPDAILLDVHLPGIPGWEVLGQLRASRRTAAIPVVMVSADATERQKKRFLEAGAVGYLTKPYDVNELLETIGRVTSPPDDREAAG